MQGCNTEITGMQQQMYRRAVKTAPLLIEGLVSIEVDGAVGVLVVKRGPYPCQPTPLLLSKENYAIAPQLGTADRN